MPLATASPRQMVSIARTGDRLCALHTPPRVRARLQNVERASAGGGEQGSGSSRADHRCTRASERGRVWTRRREGKRTSRNASVPCHLDGLPHAPKIGAVVYCTESAFAALRLPMISIFGKSRSHIYEIVSRFTTFSGRLSGRHTTRKRVRRARAQMCASLTVLTWRSITGGRMSRWSGATSHRVSRGAQRYSRPTSRQEARSSEVETFRCLWFLGSGGSGAVVATSFGIEVH